MPINAGSELRVRPPGKDKRKPRPLLWPHAEGRAARAPGAGEGAEHPLQWDAHACKGPGGRN